MDTFIQSIVQWRHTFLSMSGPSVTLTESRCLAVSTELHRTSVCIQRLTSMLCLSPPGLGELLGETSLRGGVLPRRSGGHGTQTLCQGQG